MKTTYVSMSLLSKFHSWSLSCFSNFLEALERIKPRYRFMSAYEQKVPASNQNRFVMDLSCWYFGGARAPEKMIEFEVEPPEAHHLCQWSSNRDRIRITDHGSQFETNYSALRCIGSRRQSKYQYLLTACEPYETIAFKAQLCICLYPSS